MSLAFASVLLLSQEEIKLSIRLKPPLNGINVEQDNQLLEWRWFLSVANIPLRVADCLSRSYISSAVAQVWHVVGYRGICLS